MLGREAPGGVISSGEIAEISAPLPWQANDWSQLNTLLEEEKLPHAMLLAGAPYTGKSRLALALARLLLCRQPSGGLNCGKCQACRLSAVGSHGDFRWLQPEEKSRVIKIDQVRSVVDFANKTASLGLRKVVVLSPADSMNSNAANALLKSLEEPSPDTYLILVCHRLHGVPATIRSRCQIRRLAVPDALQSLAWLDQVTGEREHSEKLLELAQGRPLLADQLYRDGNAEALAALRLGMKGLIAGRVNVPEAAAMLADRGADEFLAQLVSELQQLVRELDAEQLRSVPGKAVFGLLDEIFHMQKAVEAGANPNKQLLVETMLTKVQRKLGETGFGVIPSGQSPGDVRP